MFTNLICYINLLFVCLSVFCSIKKLRGEESRRKGFCIIFLLFLSADSHSRPSKLSNSVFVFSAAAFSLLSCAHVIPFHCFCFCFFFIPQKLPSLSLSNGTIIFSTAAFQFAELRSCTLQMICLQNLQIKSVLLIHPQLLADLADFCL